LVTGLRSIIPEVQGRSLFCWHAIASPDTEPVCAALRVLLSFPTGHDSIAEVQRHPFFAGVNWSAVRSAPAPQFVPPQPPNPDDAALDWEFQSLVRNAAPPVKYEYLPPGATV
jgi:hypothetical protein